MADRIQNNLATNVSRLPQQDESLRPADLDVLKSQITNALPAAIAPQPAAEQWQMIGLSKSPDALRLAGLGEWHSSAQTAAHVRNVLSRVDAKITQGAALQPFVEREGAMAKVLKQYQSYVEQISRERTWKN
ncbi:MAG: hypothetical protein V4534_00520 [Myxococcota bacterium]